MLMLRMGAWALTSVSDPRWNASGRAPVGGLEMPDECKERLEELKRQLGKSPADLTWAYMKD